MRMLITGGAGFIGSAVVRRPSRGERRVLVFDKLTYAGNLASLAPLQPTIRLSIHARRHL